MTRIALTYDGPAPIEQLEREGFVLDRHFAGMGVVYGHCPVNGIDALRLVDGVRLVAPAPAVAD